MSAYMPRQPEPEYMDDAVEAEAYALSDFSEVNQAFVDRLLELVGSDTETRNLHAIDLGTGPGDIPIRVSLARPGWHIVAVDASEAMLGFAREAALKAGVFLPRIEWVLADAKHTGLPAHAFDVVFSNSILHHVSDAAAFWAELARIAMPGAAGLLRDLFRPRTPQAARKIVQTYGGVGPEPMQEDYYRSLLAAYTPDEVRGQLKRAGLSPTRHSRFGDGATRRGGLKVEKITDRHMDIFGRLP